MWLRYAIVIVVAYLLGNISAGKLVAKHIGHVDISKVGSGNAGTTNVLRTLGWVPSVLTLVGDVLKAVVSALLGSAIAGETGMYLTGVAVMAGHIWPVLYNFKGGKGIAAAFGFIIFSDPVIAAILFVIQIAVIALTRYMSLASILSCVLYPVLMLVFRFGDTFSIVCAAIMCAMALFAHRSNMTRLINKNENRLDFKKINEISKRKK